MIRGVNKQVIEVNDTGNEYFEKAILYVRPQFTSAGSNTLRSEAGRMLSQWSPPMHSAQRRDAAIDNAVRRDRRRRLLRRRITLWGIAAVIMAGCLLAVYFIR